MHARLAACQAGTLKALLSVVICLAWQANAAAIDFPLVFTRIPAAASGFQRSGALADRWSWFENAQVALLETNGSIRVLSTDFASACDPNVSFDGSRILFAGRKAGQSKWRIYEMDMGDGRTRALTPASLDARSPIYVSPLNTLESPEPWFTAVFVVRENVWNESWSGRASSLYSIRLDGTEPRGLTHNPNNNSDPTQMWDGRIIYSAEVWRQEPEEAPGSKTQLRAIHIEGADMELYGGERGGAIQHMACATESGLVVFVEPETNTVDGAGALACVEQRRPHVTYRRIHEEQLGGFYWLYPAPFQQRVLLASRRSANGGSHGIFTVDTDTGTTELVLDTPEFDEIQAQPLRPRCQPDGHSTVVHPQMKTGTFYGLNCYDAGPEFKGQFPKGAVRRMRFIEGVTQHVSPAPSAPDLAVPRRLVGEAPVEKDGSFNVEVPADTPLLLQALDENGMAMATCGWIWVKPKESRGCIGCHEDPERIPENHYVMALRRPSTKLDLPPERRRSIGFVEHVTPILRDHCAAADCHGNPESPLRMALDETNSETGFRATYEALVTPSKAAGHGQPARALTAGKYVDAGRARTSWLAWQLHGTKTERPWDTLSPTAAERRVRLMPPDDHGMALNPDQIRILIQWIDLGAPYRSIQAEIRKE